MYVIAGVTGHTGSVVAHTLLDAKQPVRVLVRDAAKGEPWKSRGAEVAVAPLEDRAALARALTGATGAYLLLPPAAWTATGIPEQRAALTESILGAVRDARPGHVVLLSSVGAELASGTGPIQYLHPLEEGLRASGVPSTFLRCASFVENWAGMAQGAIQSGTLYHGLRADLRFPHVATPDIGRTAARLLRDGAPTGVRVVELAGPADHTLTEIAAAIGAVAGKPVAAITVPVPAMIDAIAGMGASRELAAMFGEMTAGINDGRIHFHGTPVRGTVALEQRLRELLA
jgi:uncharacterized protein YbjT (DUF2867 family)